MRTESIERASDRGDHVIGDDARFDCAAKLSADLTDRVAVARIEMRDAIEQIVHRRRTLHDHVVRVRRHAKAGGHTDAVNARELPQVRALAADDRTLCPTDILQSQY